MLLSSSSVGVFHLQIYYLKMLLVTCVFLHFQYQHQF